jgi:hypothetical protein
MIEYAIGDIVIINEKVARDLPMRCGNRGVIIRKSTFNNFEFDVECDDGDVLPLKSSEVNKLTTEDKRYMEYIFTNNQVIFDGKKVVIGKVNYLTQQTDILDENGVFSIVEFKDLEPIHIETNKNNKLGKFGEIGLEIGKFTDDKNKQYGSSVDATYEMMKVLMDRYTYDEDNYLIPKELVKHMLLQVRIMDKQNRIFNNPSGKNEKESPYKDITGYGLIGVNMVEGK